ncbi:MAG: histidine kinase [Sphaerochaetaceae bacterium]|nr:histidine kinase [Sphaerochaetaceae bacterium]
MKNKKKQPVTLRLLLYIIFSICVLIPVVCFMIVIPSFFRREMNTQLLDDVESKLVSVSNELVNTILSLQQISILPYSDKEIFELLNDKGNNSIINLSEKVLFFDYMKLLYNDITSLIILGENGNIYYYHRNQNNSVKKDYDFSRYKINEQNESYYLGAHYSDYFEKTNPKVFSCVKEVIHPYEKDLLCTVIIDSESSIFNRAFASMNMNKNTTSILLDSNNNVIYSSQNIEDNILESLRAGRNELLIDRNENKIVYRKIPIGNWTIAIIVSMESIENRIKVIYLVCIVASLITILFSFAVLRYISIKYMLKPLSEMGHVMAEVEKGNLNVHFNYKSRDEISLLGIKLNQMINELQTLIDKEYKLVISQKKAEYRALQSRIKPHFLYNSLNCIVGLNRLGDTSRLETAILDLTDMMRYSLSNENNSGWSTISDEVNFIKQYIHLEKLRFEDKLQFKLDYNYKTQNYKIPKLLIQPLVENAIVHNVEKSLVPIPVIVKIDLINKVNDCYLQIIVEDKGSGFDTSINGGGIGLSNVRERLKYGYIGSEMKVDSIIEVGTRIEILIPIKEVCNENINS